MNLRVKIPALTAITFLLVNSGCMAKGTREGIQEPVMENVLGTVCTVNLYGKGSREIYEEVFARLHEIEDRMSANREDTNLAEVNRAAGKTAVKIPPDLFYLVQRSLEFARLTGGAFDPTVGPLVKLWGIGTDKARRPSQAEIDAVLPLIGYKDVMLDNAAQTVFLLRPGMALDLGAIAKGYAADEIVKILKKWGVPRGIINLGGNVYAYGTKEGGAAWRVGIQNPRELRGEYVGVAELANKTVVTSGIYERFFEEGGVRYHHILSTKDGYPIRNTLLSVTIIAANSAAADALATGVFAMGYQDGLRLIESLSGIEAFFIFEDGTIRGSSHAFGHFTLTDKNYRLAQ
jgi:thiamine biosynthesis lipoprotein